MTDKRTQRIERLDRQRSKGVAAEAILTSLEPVLEARRQAYYRELIRIYRLERKIDESTVAKMAALDDLVLDLDNALAGGRVATRKLDEMAHDVGDDET